MYRRVVLYNSTWINTSVEVLYRVRGALLLSQQRPSLSVYDPTFTSGSSYSPPVFDDSIRLRAPSLGLNRTFEFVLDVSENQPVKESIEEISTTGVSAAVYNENGVLVCRNVPKTPASDPAQAGAPGEMTSEPIDAPGEMTSVPGEEPGEMASETIDEPGATI